MKIFSYFTVLLILCSSLTSPAFAEEVWIMDPESSPVVVSEDGTQMSVPSSELLGENEPTAAEDPVVEDPVTEDPVVEDPVPGDPVSDPDDEFWDESWLMDEPAAMSYSVMSVADLDDPASVSSGPGDNQSMKEVVVQVFGEYSPRTQTVTQYLSDGSLLGTTTEIVPGVAGMDWQWISGVFLFSLVLSSFLKLVGVLLKNG